MKAAVTANLLIDCIAAMPCAGGNRFRAGVKSVEKAKKTPAIGPHPRAVVGVVAA
jgi:hypothetical protein